MAVRGSPKAVAACDDSFWIDREFESYRAFSEALENLRISFRMTPHDKDSFRSRIRRRRFGDIIFAEMRVDPCAGGRNILPEDPNDYLCLTIYQQGRQTFHQAGRTIEISGKALMVWDASIPSEFENARTTEVRTLMLPKALVEKLYGPSSELVGYNSQSNSICVEALYSHINYVHECFEYISSDRRMNAIFSIIELMSACLEPNGEAGGQTRYQSDILKRAKCWIRANLEEEISIMDLANEFGMTPRALQHAFASIGTTFSAFVRTERLNHAAAALQSPHFKRESITEIAFRFGFSDSAHFSRSFKRQFNISPREYRSALPFDYVS